VNTATVCAVTSPYIWWLSFVTTNIAWTSQVFCYSFILSKTIFDMMIRRKNKAKTVQVGKKQHNKPIIAIQTELA